MSNKTPIHVARAGTVIASIYKEGEHDATYRVAVGRAGDSSPEYSPDELSFVRSAVEQAEYFIRYQEQMGRMLRCPGCGDG